MDNYCSVCLKGNILSDFTEVEDKKYCEDCFDKLEGLIVCCEECDKYEHRDANFTKNFVEIKNNGNVLYYHINCLPECFEYLLCPICKEYLEKEECIDFFIDYNMQIEHHKRCIEDKINNTYDEDICKDCCISFLRKCIGCDNRFQDCYNEKCEAYDYENVNEDFNYVVDKSSSHFVIQKTGFCSRKCYNKYGI